MMWTYQPSGPKLERWAFLERKYILDITHVTYCLIDTCCRTRRLYQVPAAFFEEGVSSIEGDAWNGEVPVPTLVPAPVPTPSIRPVLTMGALTTFPPRPGPNPLPVPAPTGTQSCGPTCFCPTTGFPSPI